MGFFVLGLEASARLVVPSDETADVCIAGSKRALEMKANPAGGTATAVTAAADSAAAALT